MANNDPTAILSAIVAVPFSLLGNGISYVVSNVWHMENKAAAAVEAGEELEIDLDEMERGESSEERYMNRGRQMHGEIRSVVEEANKLNIINVPGRYMHSRKLSKYLEALGEFKSIQGIQTILKGMRSLKLQLHERQDASFYLFSLPSCDSKLIQVGMQANVERLTSLLVESNTHYISITGMGGMGKSFLAQIVCNDPRVKEYFGKNVLWVDCGHCGHEDLDLKLQRMQEKLFLCFTGTEGNFTTLSRGNQVLRELIRKQSSQPYLLVLDNVRSRLVLKFFDLLGGGRIGSTIVTSRQQDILQHIDENDRKSMRIGELLEGEARKLFCMHAFGNTVPPIELEEYVMKFVQHCGGVPLMLEVLGKFMRTKLQPVQWKCILKKIEMKRLIYEDHEQVFEMLRMSYDALDDMDKKRFLYLASFQDSDYFLNIRTFHCWRGINFLSHDEDDQIVMEEFKQTLNRLSSASLISSHNSKIKHVPQMIKELADYIVTKDNLLKHSLRNAKCTTVVGEESYLCSSAASIEIVKGDYISSLDYFSRFSYLRALTLTGLKDLRMFDSPHMYPLSIIQLRYLQIELEKPSKLQPLYDALQQLSKLEFLYIRSRFEVEDVTLDVGFLSNMSELMKLFLLTPLQASRTRVTNCHHIQELRKLEKMVLSFFHADWNWNRPLPKDLKTLAVTGADGSTIECNGRSPFFTPLWSSTTLEFLNLEKIQFLEVPEMLHCPSLETLYLKVAMERLPRGWLQSLPCLKDLEINGGGKLMELPFELEKLPKLKRLHISWLAAEQLHITPTSLSSLSILHCEALENISILKSIPSLQLVDIGYCGKLLHLPSMPSTPHFTCYLWGEFDSLEIMDDEPYLRKLRLVGMRGFPLVNHGAFGELLELRVSDVVAMKHLPALVCPKLRCLEIFKCPDMESILLNDTQFSSCFPKLEDLWLWRLPKLVRLPSSLGELAVTVKDCPSLESPSSDSELTHPKSKTPDTLTRETARSLARSFTFQETV